MKKDYRIFWRLAIPLLIVVFLGAIITSSIFTFQQLEASKIAYANVIRASASEVARVLRVPVKINDVNTVSRVLSQTSFRHNVESILVILEDGKRLFSVPSGVKTCSVEQIEEPIVYVEDILGMVRVCYKTPHYYFGIRSLWAVFVSIVFFLLLSLAIIMRIRKTTMPVDELLSWLDRIDPVEPVSPSINKRALRDAHVAGVFRKIEGLLSKICVLNRENQQKIRSEAIVRTVQMVAHDVKHPFTSLHIGMNLLEKVDSIESMKETIELIRSSVADAQISVNAMLDELLEFGRAGKRTLQMNDVNLADLLQRAVQQTQNAFARQISQVSTAVSCDLLVHVDSQRMIRVVGNILGNAFQAAGPQGKVWVEASTCSEVAGVEVRIRNSGPPILEADMPHLFDAFFTKGKSRGTGLGLAIAKSIVEEHGGTIGCRLVGSERQVEFFFLLPRATEAR